MKFLWSLLFMTLMIAADQASKLWVEANLALHEPVDILPFLAFFRTYNTGIAFSFLAFMDDKWLIALTLAIMVFVGWLWWRTPAERVLSLGGFVLVFGGAAGNLIDRLMYGHVIDFIQFHTASWSFAIFNLADSFISVGAGLILLDELFSIRRDNQLPADGGENQ